MTFLFPVIQKRTTEITCHFLICGTASFCLSNIHSVTFHPSLGNANICPGLPRWLCGKESASQAGEKCPIPGLGRFHGEGMATHSSFLAWEMPWTEDPHRLQSMGHKSQTCLSS